MVPKTCSIEECSKVLYSQGLCRAHLMRKKDYGDPLSKQAEIDQTCSIEGCGRTDKKGGRGWCGMHWKRWRKHGSTDCLVPHYSSREEAYAARTVQVGDCIEWTGYRDPNGYGKMHLEGEAVHVHRYVFALHHGEIPKGMHIDHICHNPPSSNIAHLRLATPSQNAQNHSGASILSATGVRGVYPSAHGGYYAQTSSRGKKYTLGTFRTIEEAEAAVIAKRNELHTHNDWDRILA